jgi:histidine triad (HIT) family protein
VFRGSKRKKLVRKPEEEEVGGEQCVFCRIISGELPSRKIYEDDDIVAFHDINPAAPVHFMIVPKQHVPSMAQLEKSHQDIVGRMMILAAPLAAQQGSVDGFRTIVNTGRVGRQDVMHLHMHVLGGDKPLPGMIQKS